MASAKAAKQSADIVIYQAKDGETRLEVPVDGETVWLTQAEMAQLFGTQPQAITRHIKAIYDEGELERGATCSKMEQVQIEGNREVKRERLVYNLDMILSVGYRVNSKLATDFRKWASSVLKEYLIKGFSLDDERLKAGRSNYWHELLERIRDIRSSERMLYQQVLDLYATAADYDPNAIETRGFFKTVQNKLHFGAHGHTAPEVIWERADADKPYMGLTSFSGDDVTKRDVTVAKNYLGEDELKSLNALVSGYFDIAEFRAMNHVVTTMADYVNLLDDVITSTGAPLLQGAGRVSRAQANAKAVAEYRDYQAKAIPPVERAYLKSLKQLGDQAKREVRREERG